MHAIVLIDMAAVRIEAPHDLWTVVTQDCDLDRLDENDHTPHVEVRPLFTGDNAPKLGVRSKLFRFSHDRPEYLNADSAREMISAAALCSILEANPNAREDWLDPGDLAALKTWLGRRYNRPAVPNEFGKLMRRIAEEIESCPKEVLDHVRSVHAAIDAGQPPTFSLYALTDGQVNGDQVRGMLAEAMLEVPEDLGILLAVESHTAETMTLNNIEFTYEVDASDITWGGN